MRDKVREAEDIMAEALAKLKARQVRSSDTKSYKLVTIRNRAPDAVMSVV